MYGTMYHIPIQAESQAAGKEDKLTSDYIIQVIPLMEPIYNVCT
jgi:hypothetical protein